MDTLSGEGHKKTRKHNSAVALFQAIQGHQKLSSGGKVECLSGSDNLSRDFDIGLSGLYLFMQET